MEIEKMKALIINCSPIRTGATAEIAKLVLEQLSAKYSVKSICIDDYSFSFCKGCRSCHNTAKCVMSDISVSAFKDNKWTDKEEILATGDDELLAQTMRKYVI